MAKPTVVPLWATSGSVVTPSAGKQISGWLPGERPPAQYQNWLSKYTGQWLSYLNGFFDANDGVVSHDFAHTDAREHNHTAAAFVPVVSGAGNFIGTQWTLATSTSTAFYAPMPYLRVGDLVTSINFVYDRGGVGTITYGLARGLVAAAAGASAFVTPGSASDAVTVTGVASHAITFNHTVQAGYYYYLTMTLANTAHRLQAAQVFKTHPLS